MPLPIIAFGWWSVEGTVQRLAAEGESQNEGSWAYIRAERRADDRELGPEDQRE